ncbi:FMRFamide receptor-like [Ylistrum balloti]|uniref:FMRFamide receptor-like n=1 Tax=Ylistrum balloti TaxID=509963 RepID=UPI002905B189|nr:FMRFamide receptor-like [Ylistrum balloti]XP_060067668.1 FMRFamide receptor-like [Ylistrum balloti]
MNIPLSALRPGFVPPNSSSNGSTFLIRRDYLSKLEWPNLVHVIYPVIIPMLLILGIIGNSLTIAVLWHKKMQSSTTILLFRALVITDMAVTLVWSLNAVSEYYLFQIPEGNSYYLDVLYPCIYIVLLYVIYFFRGINIWITITLCAERFIFVCVFHKANVLCTKKRATIVLAIIVVFFFVFSIQQLIEFEPVSYPCYGELCYINYLTVVGKAFYDSKVPFWLNLLMYNILPTLLLGSLSIPIICKLCITYRKRVRMMSTSPGTLQSKETNVTIVLLLIVLFSVLSNLNGPFLVAVYVYNVYKAGFVDLICVFNTIVILNSSINFIIYGVVGMRFRKILIKILKQAYYKVLRKNAPAKDKSRPMRDENASSDNGLELTLNDTSVYKGI